MKLFTTLRAYALATLLAFASIASPMAAYAADLTVTSTSTVKGSNARTERGTAGVAITAGQAVYYDSAAATYKLSDADSATVAARSVRGIALNTAAIGQPVEVQFGGDLTLGATLTANTPYFLSGTAGGIAPIADVGTGEYLVMVGIAKSTSVLSVNIVATGVAN